MIDLRELIQKISQAKDKLELQNIKSQFLGKNSQINQEFKKLGSLSEEDKKIKASSLNNEKQKSRENFIYWWIYVFTTNFSRKDT